MGVFYVTLNVAQSHQIRCVGCGKFLAVTEAELEQLRKSKTDPPIYGYDGLVACSQQCVHGGNVVYVLTQNNWLLVEHQMLRVHARA